MGGRAAGKQGPKGHTQQKPARMEHCTPGLHPGGAVCSTAPGSCCSPLLCSVASVRSIWCIHNCARRSPTTMHEVLPLPLALALPPALTGHVIVVAEARVPWLPHIRVLQQAPAKNHQPNARPTGRALAAPPLRSRFLSLPGLTPPAARRLRTTPAAPAAPFCKRRPRQRQRPAGRLPGGSRAERPWGDSCCSRPLASGE